MRFLFCIIPYFLMMGLACKKSKTTPDPAPIPTSPKLDEYKIKPSLTNNLITTYDNEHYVYLDNRVSAKNKLLVYFPGTFANPSVYTKILQAAAGYGYHVIGLMYQNASDMYVGCSFNADNNCFNLCRLEIYDGVDRTTNVSVTPENSIKSRLLKLLQYLQVQYPNQQWGQFINGTDVQWSKCVLSGHSQGGGHAEYIGKINLVDRVISFSSIDWNSLLNTSANWITTTGNTPISKYYSINHTLDELFAYPNVQQQLSQLGLYTLGAPVNIDSVSSPYNNSHSLYTRATPYATAVSPFHNCTAVNSYIPQNATGDINSLVLKAWEYALGK